jgi:hypothetical protein
MKASDAKAKKTADGKYEVTFTVEGKKLYADGKGKETEAPLDEPFDIGRLHRRARQERAIRTTRCCSAIAGR